MMKDIIKPGLVLLVITMVAGLGLSVVYAVTREPVAQRMAESVELALGRIFPEGGSPLEVPGFEPGDEIFSLEGVQRDGQLVGYAVGSRYMGFGGVIYLLVGIDLDGAVTGIDVLRHSETPGFGGNLTQPHFIEQFPGKYGHLFFIPAGSDVEYTASDEIVALTSATNTTRAVIQAVNNALAYFVENLAD